MMKFRENEDAVSPVIGVILMVAITVILAAVIAAFVFGMGTNIGTTKTVAVTASQNGNDITLTYHGGADAATLKYLKVTIKDSGTTKYIYSEDGQKATMGPVADATKDSNGIIPVGASVSLTGGTTQQDHVVVVGHFADGSDHVVLDTYV
ncbi:type IV pilin N-terminal domain-containing protein [Methanoculleus sp. YWC-01]|uniref:Type IV pilin N-terminal domain-containing protein n=1 Tax=Methanoculleus nereidis TaxID=2735141 RepID=A0ABU3Z4U7_9EURY|nr:type IV pilin N-terminal domain-containing protein [Methanoculleus sp. YWC-01]MDV4343856.1 type IV pilin N-terminal domain-containing protein [Methanoculleus sp. YWC-01]